VNTSASKILMGQFLKLCELGFWNRTVLKVANGMIPVCMEFMHVLAAPVPLTAGHGYNGGSDASPDASQDVHHTLFVVVERSMPCNRNVHPSKQTAHFEDYIYLLHQVFTTATLIDRVGSPRIWSQNTD
jgi:hypothetical protein